jgi:hypothetical protein
MNDKRNFIIVAMLIIFAAITRLMPHPFNFTAIGALALLSGSVIPNKKFAFLVPIAAMLMTDAIIGFHASMIPVYICFIATVWIGMTMVKQINLFSVPAASITASLLFFLVTNLPFWYADISLYPLTWQGTVESYTAALPFFGNQLGGDLFYSTMMFGAYALFRQRETASVKA